MEKNLRIANLGEKNEFFPIEMLIQE